MALEVRPTGRHGWHPLEQDGPDGDPRLVMPPCCSKCGASEVDGVQICSFCRNMDKRNIMQQHGQNCKTTYNIIIYIYMYNII